MTQRDQPADRDEAAPPTAGPTYRPHAGIWNTRVEPVAAPPAVRYDPFAALGHEASRHGHVAGPAHALRDHARDGLRDHAPEGQRDHADEHGPVHSLWPHADEPADAADARRTAWRPDVVWRPTPAVPFPRPAPSAELDPPAWA